MAMASSDNTAEALKFAVEVATTEARHWLDYRALVRRALPDGIEPHREEMLRAAFSRAWEAAQQEGFERGIAFSARVYGRPARRQGPDSTFSSPEC